RPTVPRHAAAPTPSAASPEDRSASAMPGTGRSSTPEVASGVTSRGDTPVPPTVSTRSTPPITAVLSALRISTMSARTTTEPSTMNPASSSSSVTSGPIESSVSPWAVRSSTTTTRARPSRCALRSMTPTVVVGSPDPRKPHSAFRLRLRAVTRPRASRTEEETGSRVVPHPPRHGTCRLERWLVSAAIRGRASSVRIDRLAAERHIDGAPAFERQRDLLPRSPGADRRDQRVRVVDVAVADLDHDVAPLETRLVGRAVGLDVGDGRAALPGVADRGTDEG